MLLPHHAPIGGGPDFSPPLRILLPRGAGRLVQEDDLTWRKSRGIRHLDGIFTLYRVGRQGHRELGVRVVSSRRKQRHANDDQRRRLGADLGLEWLGAVCFGDHRLARPGAAQRDPLVEEKIVPVVDQECAGRQLHDLADRTYVDGGLYLCGIVNLFATRVQRGADRRSRWNSARPHHARLPACCAIRREKADR
ncbi:hypothetical protein ES703_81051 [subsurface metagenome]